MFLFQVELIQSNAANNNVVGRIGLRVSSACIKLCRSRMWPDYLVVACPFLCILKEISASGSTFHIKLIKTKIDNVIWLLNLAVNCS